MSLPSAPGCALFLSPHLDDVAFSCGGTLRRLVEAGYETILLTLFTASVPHPQGFALSTQLDKGLPPEVDYLALRREEDHAFARRLGVARVEHWPFREAPHRGYESAAELFAGVRPEDRVWEPLAEKLRAFVARCRPSLIFAPQALGGHVDHLQTVRAVTAGLDGPVGWYRDVPYALRHPEAESPFDLPERAVLLSPETLARKIAGCGDYRTQVPFQFGGPAEMERQLTAFHEAEAARLGHAGARAEIVRSAFPLPSL